MSTTSQLSGAQLLNTKFYEDIAEKRSADYATLEKVLDLVKQYIITSKRVLYGGMAIDFALKLAGKKGIYTDDTIPDYDFMSPDFLEDSSKLADILMDAGMENVSSINALHITSRRVRVNFVAVADITYIPKRICDKVPTLLYKGLRFVHPYYQRIDMHRALSLPYENPPREVINSRTKKDLKRFALLAEAYPISKLIAEGNTIGGSVKLTSSTQKPSAKQILGESSVVDFLAKYKTPERYESCLTGGLLAYEAYRLVHEELMGDIVNEGDKIPVRIKKLDHIVYGSDTMHDILAKIPTKVSVKYYHKYLDDLRPQMAVINEIGPCPIPIQLQDLKGLKFARNKKSLFPEKCHHLMGDEGVGSMQYLMMQMLQRYYEHDDKQALLLYQSCENMIIDAEKIIGDDGDQNQLAKLFMLTADTYGKYNWSPTYVYSMSDRTSKMSGNDAFVDKRPQFGYYPKKDGENQHPRFNISEFYELDGEEAKTLNEAFVNQL